VQDGFDLYLHGFVVTDDGQWVVVQQGMNGKRKQARHYHWLSETRRSFVEEPHAAIDGVEQGEIINLTDRWAEASRRTQLDILQSLGPDGIARELRALEVRDEKPGPLTSQPRLPYLIMPAHHEVRPNHVLVRRLHGNLAAAADRGPSDFCELLLIPGIGARTVRWRWSPKSYTEPRSASPTQRGSRLPTAVRTGIRFLCRSACTIKPFRC
jgi:uncharacterized protein